MRILLVEDDHRFSDGVKAFFEERGHEAVVADDSWRTSLALGLRKQGDRLAPVDGGAALASFDAMILDNGLRPGPYGDSGPEFMQWLARSGLQDRLPPLVAADTAVKWQIRFPTAIGYFNKLPFDEQSWKETALTDHAEHSREGEYEKLMGLLQACKQEELYR